MPIAGACCYGCCIEGHHVMVAENGEQALTKGDGWELNVAAGQIAWTEEVRRLLAGEY